MSRVFFRQALEGVATFWRIRRCDGVTLGLTSHDRDLWFDGVRHRAAPGMSPSAIRRSSDLASDSAEVHGALTHDSIAADDLGAGRFDGAGVEIGVVDWETLDRAVLYRGEIGGVTEEAGRFGAELISAKAALEADLVPRTSPTCRARFGGPGLRAERRALHARGGAGGGGHDCQPGQFRRGAAVRGHARGAACAGSTGRRRE
jgi:uncharacterized phage protein (TIGR02218 family)